jgi:hypothetical protein
MPARRSISAGGSNVEVERQGRHFIIGSSKLDIGNLKRGDIGRRKVWVFTSAFEIHNSIFDIKR